MIGLRLASGITRLLRRCETTTSAPARSDEAAALWVTPLRNARIRPRRPTVRPRLQNPGARSGDGGRTDSTGGGSAGAFSVMDVGLQALGEVGRPSAPVPGPPRW